MTTYTLTTEEFDDFRADLDIEVGQVFTDAELNRLYTRAGGDYNTAVAYAWRQILASASKMTDYKAAQSSESLSQLYTHVEKQLARAEKLAGVGAARAVVNIIGLNIDATSDNETEWDGSGNSEDEEYPGY